MDPWMIGVITMVVVLVMTRAAPGGDPRRLARLESKIDLVLRHLGLVYDPLAGAEPDVLQAIREGKKIEAIKRYRAATGADLAEAKDRVEELQAHLLSA
jgi:hypothetical protein